MFAFLTKLLLVARSRLQSRTSLEAENLALRQQVIVLSRKSRSRVRLRNIDRLTLAWLYRFFPSSLSAIVIVKPETVIRWHRRASICSSVCPSSPPACPPRSRSEGHVCRFKLTYP